MATILGANSLTGAYQVENSMMLETGDSSRLSKTFSSASNSNTTFTVSAWFKKTKNGATQDLISAFRSSDGLQTDIMRFGSTDDFEFYAHTTNSSGNADIQTGRVFRDVGAWYHIVVRVDTTQGTAGNRVRIYVNGVQETVFTSSNYMNQNGTIIWGLGSGIEHTIGAVSTSNFFSGYVAEVVYLDGQSLGPTSFGEFDPDTPTTWRPIDVSGLTFGNNSFYLDFKNSAELGTDVSGNSHTFTENNLAATDQHTDTCTNNFATMNSLDNFQNPATFSQGNLKIATATSGGYAPTVSNFGLNSGKWYAEVKYVSRSHSDNYSMIGVRSSQSTNGNYLGQNTNDYAYYSGNGKTYSGGSASNYGNSYDQGETVGIYLDLDNNKLYFSKDGTLQNSGTGVSITAPGSTSLENYFFSAMDYGNSVSNVYEWNFGGGTPTTISSGNADDNGYGNFEYSPNITGDGAAKSFYALNSKNLAEFG
mgnify:CR=1 FL=1|tara:strand:+ start:137 stop:1567 length:1431 start_codon:yes stop_codon:yes gene_type:complete